jgi:SAM-dependent methyltransferase
MLQTILELASSSAYDFRDTAYPEDPLKHLFEEWVPYYRLKWAIVRTLQPRSILEIGVRFGYSAAAFLDASPNSSYLGIDNDSDTSGGRKGAINWARRITSSSQAKYLIADSQKLDRLPGGAYDLIHIDGQQDGLGSINDLQKALKQARYILVDGFFWTRDNFLNISEFLFRYKDLIESCIIIPGYAGELLINVGGAGVWPGRAAGSKHLRDAYTASYYLEDCGGFESFKRDKGLIINDWRLQAVAQLTEIVRIGRALDLGCGRGELAIHLAKSGSDVTAVDYSRDAIELARAAAGQIEDTNSKIVFECCDVNDAPLSGLYDLAVASDLIEHLAPEELNRLYSNVASHLSRSGLFVVHTFPNLWYYTYGHARRMREARRIGAYIPFEPRSRYEELMHINEQSPRVLKRQLSAHFPHVLLWFANHGLEDPFENLRRRFSKAEMRMAGDLFALASHSPIDLKALLKKMTMLPLTMPLNLSLEALEIPASVGAGDRFRAHVRLTNNSSAELKSRNPNPVHLSYHWYSEHRHLVAFDGMRTPIPLTPPGCVRDISMHIIAPPECGRFMLRATIVQELVCWFDEAPQELFIDAWVDVTPS